MLLLSKVSSTHISLPERDGMW